MSFCEFWVKAFGSEVARFLQFRGLGCMVERFQRVMANKVVRVVHRRA